MRTDLSRDVRLSVAQGALVVVVLAVVGLALGEDAGAAAGAAIGAVLGLTLWRTASRRQAARRQLLRQSFPAEWREILRRTYDHFERLPESLRARFEDDVRIFLATKRITGVETEADDELRLLVAASAVTLSLAWEDFEWDALTEVLLYPHDFARDYGYERADLAGQAHPWGTVILSVPALRQGFMDPDDGYHVGLHEFAHLLDVEQNRMGGIFGGLSALQQREWVTLMESEMSRMRNGRSVIDSYGAHEPAEFLAVAVEAFFEMPLAIRGRHRELYTFLAAYFRQDPAAWDDARGLAL